MNTSKALSARALLLGTRIDDRIVDRSRRIAVAPLVQRCGAQGWMVLFRFGATVLIDVDPKEEAEALESLVTAVEGRFPHPESEVAVIHIEPGSSERLGPEGEIFLHEATVQRLQIVAQVLAKSVVLGHYERQVTGVFDRVENHAEKLHLGTHRTPTRALLRDIGDVLLIQARTLGRAEVTDKPDLTWDDPELDRLYERLAAEYELRDRDRALNRKLELISDTARTYLDLLHHRQTLRVEWYIVLLIVFDIGLTFYDWFLRT